MLRYQYVDVWVGFYTKLFYEQQYSPVLNAEPHLHACNEVLMWVHGVPEEQAAAAAAAECCLHKCSYLASLTGKAAVKK